MFELGNETILSKKNLIPKEGFLYFPTEEVVIQYNKNDPCKSIRRIFEGGIKYYDFEEDSITNFNQELTKREIILPSDWLDCDTLRFLQATSHDYTRTILLILDHLEWKKNRVPIVPSDKTTEILNSGFLYVHGRDNRFRPIMVLDPFIFHKLNKKYSTQEWVLSMIYLFEYIKVNCFLPGQIENWNIICDVAKVNILFIPPEFKEILTSLQSNYRCRLYVMLIINVSLLIKSLWNIIKNILDKTTERKIRMINVDQNVDIEVFSFINRSQVEKKFGGDAENLGSTFFPPTFPSNDYFTDYDNPKELLVSEEVYKKKIQDNCLLIPSPFIDLTKLNKDVNDLIPSSENEKKIEKNNHNTESKK